MSVKGVMLAASMAGVVALVGAKASAADITRTFDVTASDFGQSQYGPYSAPVDPVHLDFTVTLDPTVDSGVTTSGLDVLSFNLPYSSEYDYSSTYDILTIGTDVLGGGFANPPDSYGLYVSNPFSPTPSVLAGLFQYSTSVEDTVYGSYQSFSATVSIGAVPEPTTWALLVGGIALAGAGLRYRTRARIAPVT